ncbi:MAG TPA: glutamine amidotransferase [Candidatus Glassbacteria bacterium]|nr:glutamine amidotransferase [Candidatus Glassbacteria bacterium]
MAKIYYVGDWAVQCGPIYAETPFNYAYKGLETINYGKWLKAALESSGAHSVESVATWDFYGLGPGEYEKVLEQYDILIFSDVEAKNFQLAPSFFNHKLFGTRVLTFPDRIRLTVESIKQGKSVMFLGGWLSFSGEMGKGGWKRSGLNEILPVECLDHEDLVESTEGFTAERGDGCSNVFTGIDFDGFPPILGYNKTVARTGSTVHLTIRQTGDPLLVTSAHGRGKVLTYMSDPAPHWGCNFIFWESYDRFWLACAEMVL